MFNVITLRNNGKCLALRRELVVINSLVINAAVVPTLVLISDIKSEDGRVPDGSLVHGECFLVEACEDEAEMTSGKLWLHGTVDKEAVRHIDDRMIYFFRTFLITETDVRLMKYVCK